MKKADYKFHRDKKHQIENASKENEPSIWQHYRGLASSNPIFIPKRKKKK